MEEDKGKERHKPTIPIIRSKPNLPPPVPEDFGEYRIIEEHGCGGMGWILKAVHKKLDVIHALKILHPALSRHEEFVANFKREAQLAAKLQYPNIVTIHNTGEFAGFHYIAMEFIDGVNLAKALPERGIPYPVVLGIAVKILDALDHAHNYEFSHQGQTYYGLIHRDIKPENIIIDNNGEVKITDFGIARGIHLYGDVTTEGTIVGTPSYMSPEQIDGTEKISHTTDIYSLGVLMYELLSGKKAFDGTTTQIIRRISNHEYESLSRASRTVPAEIIRIVDKAMSFNPDDRFQSAFEMREAISKYLSQFQYDDPSVLIKKHFVERITPAPMRKRKRRKPGKLLAKTAKVLGVVALIFVILMGAFYAYKAIIIHRAQKALALLDERLNLSQVNNASVDFGGVKIFLDSANAVFSTKNYGETRALCDSGAQILDSLIIFRERGIRTRYARISEKADRAEGLGSTVDFRGEYFLVVDDLMVTEEFDRADSVLSKAESTANDEIWRLTPREEKDELEKLARSQLRNAKNSLAAAKKDRPDINFSEVERMIAKADELFGQKSYIECGRTSEQAARAITDSMLSLPPTECPRVEMANRHYDSLSVEQKQKPELVHARRRMNELGDAGRCEPAKVFVNMIFEEPVKKREEKRPEPVVAEPEEELTDSAHFVRGTNLEANGDKESALKHYQEVKPAATKQGSWKYYLPARFRMGVIFQIQEQYEKALAAYKEVLSLKNTNYYETCFLNTGVCFFHISSYDSAIAYFKDVERFKGFIVPDPAKGETQYYHTDLWHDAMYYWALALTKLYYRETDPEKKRQLRGDAIRKWEDDYWAYYKEYADHPRRGEYVRNAQVLLTNLKREG